MFACNSTGRCETFFSRNETIFSEPFSYFVRAQRQSELMRKAFLSVYGQSNFVFFFVRSIRNTEKKLCWLVLVVGV